MTTRTVGGSARRRASLLVLAALALAPSVAAADEGGVSFWLPGLFGSLAAAPQQPGSSFTTMYYHTTVSAGADVAFARQVTRGQLTANFTANLSANLNADADLGMAIPSYVFATPVLGGQAAVALLVPFGPQHRFGGRDADRRDRTLRLLGVGRPQRHRVGLRRFDSAGLAALERRRA